ncbi:MAG: DUF475 domain-containing protein [Methylococcaceae bacterium]|nr:MAG: DUF475 domain-containing protein [Methylococcaceae bacterium]
MKDFLYSIVVTLLCLGGAYLWGSHSGGNGWGAMALALVLGVMEISISFDNAVVNASVLKEMDRRWQQIFLTVGILIAVFGMRLLFPLVIVAVATGQGLEDVALMALHHPETYSSHLKDSHVGISAFGGMFLLLVFLAFMLNEAKELHWIAMIEKRLAALGKLDSMEVMVALLVLFLMQHYLTIDAAQRLALLTAGVAGVILHIGVSSLDRLFASEDEGEIASNIAKRAGIAGFLYLEVLDASFSFDGVIGAFAITRDVVVIMLGLAIGAMFVRSLTVFLVNKGTLDDYVFLEHGAHWAIGMLAAIMLAGIVVDIPEVFTGLIGVVLITLSLVSSVRYKRLHAKS